MSILLLDEVKKTNPGGIYMKAIEGQIGKKEEDYFKTAAILLSDPGYLKTLLLDYDKEHINP